jgi:hypothetical protein
MNNKQLTIALIIGLIFISIWWYAYSKMAGTDSAVQNEEIAQTDEMFEEENEVQESTDDVQAPVTTTPLAPQTNTEVEPTPEEATSTEDEALPERETPEEVEAGSYVQAVFSDENTERCTWTDRTSGLDGMALIKDGKVRVETEQEDADEQLITLYNSVATYIWVEDADEGMVIPNDLEADDEVVTYQTRSEIAEYLETNEWVDCNEQALSDSHFEVPRDVDFTEIGQ